MSLLSRLFGLEPAYDVSGYGWLYKAVVSALEREGVKVGKTAAVPRVEVHSIQESERMDKEGQVRQFTMTVESIGNASLSKTVKMNDDNLKLLTSGLSAPDGWDCLGVVPGQLQDLTETSDTNKIIYRLLQSVTIWVSKVKTEPEDEEPETITSDPGNPGQPVNPITPITPGGPVVIH